MNMRKTKGICTTTYILLEGDVVGFSRRANATTTTERSSLMVA
jgi:hypothetical protein